MDSHYVLDGEPTGLAGALVWGRDCRERPWELQDTHAPEGELLLSVSGLGMMWEVQREGKGDPFQGVTFIPQSKHLMTLGCSSRKDLALREMGGASGERKPEAKIKVSPTPPHPTWISALEKGSSLSPSLVGGGGSRNKGLSHRETQASLGASLATNSGGSPEAGRALEQTWFKGKQLRSQEK